MKLFEIVAHRGVPNEAPENALEAFQHAVKLGADAIEFDVSLTADGILVIYNYFYLEEITNTSGTIFNITYNQLQKVKVINNQNQRINNYRILTFNELLETNDDQIGLEVEIKCPKPESVEIIGGILNCPNNVFYIELIAI